MSDRTINIDAYHVEFERNGNCVIANFAGETVNGNRVRVKAKFSFTCLPHFIPRLRKTWEEERNMRAAEIARIDHSLGL